jgi:hypothetical protein
MSDGTELAPPGQVWICGACGKRSRTRCGFVDNGTPRGGDFLPDGSRVADSGWDESCMLHAVLISEQPESGARGPDELLA